MWCDNFLSCFFFSSLHPLICSFSNHRVISFFAVDTVSRSSSPVLLSTTLEKEEKKTPIDILSLWSKKYTGIDKAGRKENKNNDDEKIVSIIGQILTEKKSF